MTDLTLNDRTLDPYEALWVATHPAAPLEVVLSAIALFSECVVRGLPLPQIDTRARALRATQLGVPPAALERMLTVGTDDTAARELLDSTFTAICVLPPENSPIGEVVVVEHAMNPKGQPGMRVVPGHIVHGIYLKNAPSWRKAPPEKAMLPLRVEPGEDRGELPDEKL